MSFGQGGPQWGGGGPQHDPYGRQDPHPQQSPAQTPDWGALAEASAARNRRKRWFLIGGGALAAAVVAAIVATAVVSMNSGSTTAARPGSSGATAAVGGAGPAGPTGPAPSFSSVAPAPPPDPNDFIDSAAKDKAPLGTGTLYPGGKLTVGNRVYAKAATSTTGCAAASQGALGAELAAHGCDRMYRATYTRDGVAVTVGIATFADRARAQAAEKAATGGIASLPGAGVPVFCRNGVICRQTTNSYARYVYFTVGGFTDAHNVTEKDTNVSTASSDLGEFAFRQILARGVTQASAAAKAPAS